MRGRVKGVEVETCVKEKKDPENLEIIVNESERAVLESVAGEVEVASTSSNQATGVLKSRALARPFAPK